jgi:hypothetical protein
MQRLFKLVRFEIGSVFHYNIGNLQLKAVGKSVQHRQPYLPHHRDSLTARNIVRLSERVEKYWKYKVKDSSARIRTQAENDFQRVSS